MMKRTFPIIFLLTTLLSCQKDNTVKQYVPQHLFAMVPYKQGQIIKFISNKGEVFTSTVEIRRDITHVTSTNPETDIEVFDYIMKSGSTEVTWVEIDGRPERSNHLFLTVFNSGCDFYTSDNKAEFDCTRKDFSCLDTFTVRGKTFQNVLKYTASALPLSYSLKKMYYTKEYGVIQAELADSTRYDRML